MLIHPISITHENTIMQKKIWKIFRKSPHPIDCQIYCVDKCETKCGIVHQSKIRFIECEIAYQSKIGFECVIVCQIYNINECGIECEIESQPKYKTQSVTKFVIKSLIEFQILNVKV